MNYFLLVIIIIAIVELFLLYESYQKYKLQIEMYNNALQMSRITKKPLLVIGDPLESSTNYMFGSYGYGDICIDMNIAPSNKNNNSLIIKDKLENVLHKFPDNSVVIFESEVLEYVDSDKIKYVIQHMERISDGNIFSVHQLKPGSLTTWLKTTGYSVFNKLINKNVYTHKRLFTNYPPYGLYEYK